MSKSSSRWLVIVSVPAFLLACEKRDQPSPSTNPATEGPAMKTITIQSPAFAPNDSIPRRHTGDGDDVSPPLLWSGVPDAARELVLIVDDPDAPVGDWVHWLVYGIPADALGLPEGISVGVQRLAAPRGAIQGRNSWNKIGYGGPAPPKGHGVHHYHFKLYALDKPLGLEPDATKPALLAAMQGHIIAQGELIGTYQR
jgi:hypothetical protein